MKSRNKSKKRERRSIATSQFLGAEKLAREQGFSLIRRTETHYQLRPPTKKWIANLYPGNRKLYMDKNAPSKFAPTLPPEWDLLVATQSILEQWGTSQ